MATRVKTAKGRKISSILWLQRQLNDPYVEKAKKDGYRSRAAYKLIELDEKFHFLKPGKKIVDLGAAPGGWAQVAAKKVGARGKVVALDLKEVEPIPGVILLVKDFMEDDAPALIKQQFEGKVDIVLSDMAPNATGHAGTDHIRIMGLCEAAFEFALEVLAPGGVFVAKVWQGGTEGELLKRMKAHFSTVKHAKPKASRADSAENFVVATGFRK